jgi:4-aminobutyrate aminotransferase-like enzyme
VVWQRASGTRVWDVDGHEYLDLTAAFAVAAIGHAHPAVVEAVSHQIGLLAHAMGDVHPSRNRVELLERLAQITPGPLGVSHLGLNGADAVEAALKTALLTTGRRGILAFEGAYHGLSYGVLPLTSAHYREPFAAQLADHVSRVPFVGPTDADFSAIESIIASETIGAVVIEPVQGRGGVRPAPRGLLPALAELCSRHGALLIVDEIATGLGRTGRWFAVEEEDVTPDLLLIGKALGGGLPISAAVGTEAAMAGWRDLPGPALHTSTFLGHPLAAAAALATLDVIERESLVVRAASLGAVLIRDLRTVLDGVPGVAEVRGRGLLVGIALEHPETGAPDGRRAWEVMHELCANGILVLTAGDAGDVIELSPPLVIAESELARGVEALAAALARVPPGGSGEARE